MERQKIVSTSIRSIGFEAGVLEIEFTSGMVYQYTGPDMESYYLGMLRAPSMGQYFDRYIRKNSRIRAKRVPANE